MLNTRIIKRVIAIMAVLALSMLLILLFCGFQEQPYPATLCEALLLAGSVTVIQGVVGALIAVLLEYWPAWDGLPPRSKRPIIFGLCLVVPILALVARGAACGTQLTLDAFYLAVLAGCIAFTTSQFAHIPKLPSRKRS